MPRSTTDKKKLDVLDVDVEKLRLNFAKETYIQGIMEAFRRSSIDARGERLEDKVVLAWKKLLVENRDKQAELSTM